MFVDKMIGIYVNPSVETSVEPSVETSVEPSVETSVVTSVPSVTVVVVANHTKTTISISLGKEFLKKLYDHVEQEFNEFLGNMIITYQHRCPKDQSNDYLEFMTRESRFALINFLINKKYGNGSQEGCLLYGSELYTFYHNFF